MATVVLSLSERIGAAAEGAVIDLGCGQGTLLKRLSEIPQFRENSSWLYIGVDEEGQLGAVQELARKCKVNRRVEVFNLEEFYRTWPDVPPHQIIVCRNVLHELRIVDTARLIHHVATSARPTDTLVIQDLMRFPVSERHNACWVPDELHQCLKEVGFGGQLPVVQGTRSGNAFFNMIVTPPASVAMSLSEIEKAVASARFRQWQTWMEIESSTTATLPERDELIEALDIDLQVTALTRQLRDVGIIKAVLAPDVEQRVRASEFVRLVEKGVQDGLRSNFEIEERVHFRERGAQLTLLEDFLRGTGKLAMVHGGGGYGKTTLVHRLLATRAYGKLIVRIDGRRTKSAWAFLEELFSQVGIRLAPEQLSVLGNLTMDSVMPTVRRFLNDASHNLILFYDNFDISLGLDGEIQDPDLFSILLAILSKERIKVILSGRKEYAPRKIVEAIGEVPVTVRVGRYATEETVINILDDYFDRSASGLTEYPRSLLDAIDRHPLITSLAARALQLDGANLLLDQSFIAELTNKWREELWGRIIGPDAREAVAASANLRTPVPLDLLEGLAPSNSISAAKEEEVIYPQKDTRWNALWSTLGLFKLKAKSSDLLDDEAANTSSNQFPVDHSRIASLYRSIYRIDDDPKWIRESYYHQLLSVDRNLRALSEGVGNYYYDELVSSADYHFMRSRNYEAALELYTHATDIRPLKQLSEMRRASCLIRVGQMKEGKKAYQDLIDDYPSHLGIKTSHVDAVLYRREYEEAARILDHYGLNHESEWVEWQWGRTYLGLDNYGKAIGCLNKIVSAPDADSHYYIHLARALDYAGDFKGALSTLHSARAKFSADIGVATALGMELERHGEIEEAALLLRPLLEKHSDNVQAASAMVKIEVALGSVSNARQLARQAEASAPVAFRTLALCIHADVDVAEGHPEIALARLAKAGDPDPLVIVTVLEAFRAAVELGSTRDNAIQKARTFRVPDRYQFNARVQISHAQLGLALADQTIWDRAIDNLGRTRIDAAELAEIQEQWTG
jgi:tetratricopeptide (TPR) repeat protein